MATRRAAAVGSLSLITLAIVTNAVWMQGGRRSAPLFGGGHAASVASAPARTSAPATTAPAQPDAMVELVQRALAKSGAYTGPTDGLYGPATRAAIGDFQKKSGFVVTGVATPDLLVAIQNARGQIASVAPAPASPTTAQTAPAPAATGSLPRARAEPSAATPTADTALIRTVQQALSHTSYGPLTADGMMGPQTREAIARFQKDRHLPATGEIDDRLVAALRTSHAISEN
ncbi:Peptidoglycan-binding (PGRP) domain of peptidoglycan hydrolases-containing protein [Faunimonas pinastri]|uniref:Peptidoglycan-binding (PGRP) domain of peptidoglycan hydrolases-containing protein n=1 Tax=Faunimonas pinastri TaxID=1855383 RepID=A0A1H9MAA2_9HYPH|nr:peptidoglycan-binding domain-containing protein [Faunimonas pinastri]SER20385.1 Peptidoglycan-binding (PGRP) domain of peptidoglycan hydrolases-containing protein [Faunimonas pinastri]